MNSKELEKLLEAGIETPRVDFKESCPWNVKCFAKDILALSNVRDGGHIVVGVEEKPDGTFVRQGVTPKHKASFRIDVMRDQMSAYADPHVNFRIDCLPDEGGMQYAVIEVMEFEELPVICRKDSTDTKAGVIYYRNRNRRIESASVSNSYDMRSIIELAAVKSMQRLQGLGLLAMPDARSKLAEELEDL